MKQTLIFQLIFWMRYGVLFSLSIDLARPPPKNITVTQGNNVALRCGATSDINAIKRSWTYEASILFADLKKWTEDPRVKLESNTDFEYKMLLENVQLKDEGFYTCTIYTNETKKSSLYLTVNTPPEITEVTDDLVVNEGTSVVLKCAVEGKPQPKITWRHLLPSADRVRGTSEYLPLGNVLRDSGGRYECTADNGVSFPRKSSIKLTVNYPPEMDDLLNRPVIKKPTGKSLSVKCIALAVPSPTFSWFHPTGAQIKKWTAGSRYGFVNTVQHSSVNSELIIPSLRPSDFGNYTCIARNKLGKAKKSFLLIRKILPPTRPPPNAVFDLLTSDEDGNHRRGISAKLTLNAYVLFFNVALVIVTFSL